MNQPTMTILAFQWDGLRDSFRDRMLSAADEAIASLLGQIEMVSTRNNIGAADADLPEFFKGLDAQFERAMVRAGVWRDED